MAEPRGPLIDPAALRRLQALDPDGRRNLMPRLLQAYNDSLTTLALQLEGARSGPDLELAGRVGHTLKSSSERMGALALSALAAEVEQRARAGDVGGLVPLLEPLAAEIEGVRAAVRAMLLP